MPSALAADNGSAFAGLKLEYSLVQPALGVVIFIGRYPPIIFLMAVAGFGRAQADHAGDDQYAAEPTPSYSACSGSRRS